MSKAAYANIIGDEDLANSLPRQNRLLRTYKQIVEEILKRQFKGQLLDTGCGNNSFITAAKDFDIEGKGIDYKDVNFEKDPFPFEASSFDFVTANALVEHIREPNIYFSEVKRVLQEGGLFLLTTPNWELSHKTFYNDPTHCHPYTRLGLTAQLSCHGFQVLFLEPNFICRPRFMWKMPLRWTIPMGTRSMLCVALKPHTTPE